MGPGTEVAATTDTRRWLHALRPVLMLGGFLLAWWFLMTGTAQAADHEEHGLGTTTRALAGTVHGHHDRPTQRTVEVERRAPHSAAAKVTQAVRHHAAPVVTMAERTVERTATQPLVKTATDTVRSTVTEVVDGTRSTLDATPLGSALVPDLDEVDQLDQNLSIVGESSTLLEETRSKHSTGRPATSVSSTQFALGTGSVAADAIVLTHGEDRVSSPAVQLPADHVPGVPGLTGSTGAVSAQSGSGAGTATDASETGLVHSPATATSSSSSSAERLPAGPAYPPGSSPD